MVSSRHLAKRRGFTLAELLVVMGIIGVLSSVTISSVNPRKQLVSAADAARLQIANELEKALMQYVIDTGTLPGADWIPVPQGATSALPVCVNDSVMAACVRVKNQLVGSSMKYITALSRDETEPCPDYTGYTVYKDEHSRVHVTPKHLGKGFGDLVVCSAGCSTTVPRSKCVPICGDGLIMGSEQCDDGNLAPGDGCSAVCQLEAGFGCSGEPSNCIQFALP